MIDPVVSKGWLDMHPQTRIADVRWYLDGTDAEERYREGHIPGAAFIDLDQWLTAPPTREDGRHPLPDPETFAEGMRLAGISEDTAVVAYDDTGGQSAARLVWLLRVLGHDAALLDGGLQSFHADLETGVVQPEPGDFSARDWPEDAFVGIDDVHNAAVLLDARASERYRGEHEPIDPRAGHIPGAINLPSAGNLNQDLQFLTPDALRTRYAGYGIHAADEVVVYCGSGVTACHALVAMEYAGLGRGRLYPGSWSQFSATDRPAAP